MQKQDCLTDLIKPSYVKNGFDSIQVNSNHNRVVCAVGYPRMIKEGWLNSIVSSEGDFDLSMFVEPSQIEGILNTLNQELVKQKSDMMSAELNGIVNPSLKVQYEDTYRTLERLQTGEEKLFNFSLYLNSRANTKEKLELLTRKLESELNSMMIIPKIPYLKMQEAVKSIIPIGTDKLRVQQNIPSNALSACFPFTTSFLKLQEGGIMFGLNKDNNIPIIIDPYQLQNYNGLILGSSGSGKSFGVKLNILRRLMMNVKTFIIDPQGEYVELCKTYGGQLVEISQDSDTIINPLDLMDRDFGDKMLSLMDLFKIMCGELSEPQKNILDRALLKVYADKGIRPKDRETWSNEPPTIQDLYKILKFEKKIANRLEQVTYDALLNRIGIYAEGSFSFLNKKTNLDLNNNLICFNIAEMPSQVKPVMMYLILDFIHKKMQNNKERKHLVIDEAWTLLRYGEQANYLFEMIKTARKFGLGLTIITQEVNDLLQRNAGKTILANCAWKLLLRQEPTVIRELTEKFNLNQEEQNFVLTADRGEGLLFAMNDRIPIKIVASEKEYEIITTNPDEIRKRESKKKKDKEETQLRDEVIKLRKDYYLRNDLSEEQIDYLKSKDYKEERLCGLDKGGAQIYLIKKHNESNESIEHYFMTKIIMEEIRKYTENVVEYSTFGPDVMFQVPVKGQDKHEWYAIEVETGKTLKKNPSALEKKTFKNNHLQHLNGWFYVVTDANMKNDYSKYAETFTRTEIKKKIKELFL
ncbi:MAG: ATP-binding protein [Candidatus Diapherotrites archaeon]